jgi:hypothetical protein
MLRYRESRYGEVDPAVIAQLIQAGGAVATTAITSGVAASKAAQAAKRKRKKKKKKSKAAAEIIAAAPTTIPIEEDEPDALPSWLLPGAAIVLVIAGAWFLSTRNERRSRRA